MTRIDPLLVDLFRGDGRTPEDLRRLALAGAPWHGIILKATEGLYYHNDPWFPKMWRVAHGVDDPRIDERLGVDWWVSAYHFLNVGQDAKAQAHSFLQEVARSGGWLRGTIYPVIDVENSENQPAGVSGTQVVDRVEQWVEIVKAETGREVMLYAGHWLHELGVRTRMGCAYLWYAAYTAHLQPQWYTAIGWDLASLFAWQYNGDGDGLLAGYPHLTPLGPEDISAMTIAGGGVAALEHLRAGCWPTRP